MSNILITGGTGFVGSWMRKTEPEEAIYINSDHYRYGLWTYSNWDYIVHLAPIHPGPVLNIAKRCHARVLYCSSGIVYHPEDNSQYRQNKIQWEKECLESGVDVVIARLFTFFGDGINGDEKAIVRFFDNVRHGEPLQVYGNGSTVRSYMHGAEMARRLWDILLTGKSGTAYDVGSRKPTTILKLAKRIQAFTGAPIEFVDKPVSVPVYLPP